MTTLTPHNPRAFTLVELLVVISIIAVLVGILSPALAAARDRAVLVREVARGRDNASAYLMYATEHRDYVLMAVTELSRAIPEPLREPARDLRGAPITDPRNGPVWFWRLAPYLEGNLDAFYRDKEHLSAISSAGPSRTDYYLSTWYPAFGINQTFVGGKPDYYPVKGSRLSPRSVPAVFGHDFWVRKTTDAPRPSQLMAMVSTATDDPNAGRFVEGYYLANAPAFSTVNTSAEWFGAPLPDEHDNPGSTGNVRTIAAGHAVGVFLDGHAEPLPWDRLATDMRLWAPQATTPDYRVEPITR